MELYVKQSCMKQKTTWGW